MILINLLPHREEKRRLRKQAFFAGLGLSAAAGAAPAAAVVVSVTGRSSLLLIHSILAGRPKLNPGYAMGRTRQARAGKGMISQRVRRGGQRARRSSVLGVP